MILLSRFLLVLFFTFLSIDNAFILALAFLAQITYNYVKLAKGSTSGEYQNTYFRPGSVPP